MAQILLLGGDADSNVGDTAILLSLGQCIARALPHVRLSVTSNQALRLGEFAGLGYLPRDTAVLPKGLPGFASLLTTARRQDLIIVGGGGLFQDDDSRIKMPYWAARIGMLSALNSRIVGHSLGAGPLQHEGSRRFARLACESLQAVSVRDGFAQGWLSRSIGRDLEVVPDPAFMLTPAEPACARSVIRHLGIRPRRPFIAVALRRWFHVRGGFVPHRIRAAAGLDSGEGAAQMTALRTELAQALRALARRLDASILLMPSYHAKHEGDVDQCQSLLAQLHDVEARMLSIRNPALYKSVAGLATVMISARMHPLIFAASMGVPIVGLGYNGKFEGLFNLLGRKSGLLWLENFERGGFAGEVERVALDAMAEPNDLKVRSAEMAAAAAAATRELATQATS